MPCLPRPCRVIAGWLDDDNQFWKVSYHWDILLYMMQKAAELPISVGSKQTIQDLCKELKSNPPNPASGYWNSPTLGEPHDSSPHDKVMERWHTVKRAKASFKKVLSAEKIQEKYPPAKRWDLAVAPVAPPGTSKHGCGYAVDIEGIGKHELIKKVCISLGGKAFDEASHVHVEFKQGILIGKSLVAEDKNNGKWSGWMHSERNLPDEWFAFTGNRSYGPYDLKQLGKLLEEKRITEATPIARKGAKSWGKMADDPALKALLQGANKGGTGQGKPKA